MLNLQSVNHIAIIASDYNRSLSFYTQILGMEVISEVWRPARKSMMCRLALNGEYLIELFTFPGSPPRPSYPESCGLRHLAFSVPDINDAVTMLERMQIPHEPVRTAPDGELCCFFHDPDGLPIELVEKRNINA